MLPDLVVVALMAFGCAVAVALLGAVVLRVLRGR
jgi:hypothetical protein